MATKIFTTSVNAAGYQAVLANGDDAYVARGVVVGSTDTYAIIGQGSGHSVVVYGEVVGGGASGISLGFDGTSQNEKVKIYAGGSVSGFGAGYGGIALTGSRLSLDNAGDVWGDYYGAYFGASNGSLSTLDNTGTISSGSHAVYLTNTGSVSINNSGTIDGYGNSVYVDEFNGTKGYYNITNTGTMNGGILATNAALLYYNGENGHLIGGIDAGIGDDYLAGGVEGDSFYGGGGFDRLFGNGGNDLLFGQAGGDVLQGGVGDDTLDGGTEADTMAGGAGNDAYYVDDAGDVVTELKNQGTDSIVSSVSYTLTDANIENLRLTGTDALSARGNALANIVVGNDGSNRIDGDLGADTLAGAGGNDRFRFVTKLGGTNVDHVYDFTNAAGNNDRFDIDNAVFLGLPAGKLAAGAFHAGTVNVATQADDRIVYNTATGDLFFDRDGSGTAYSAVHFATLDNKAALTAADFYVI